MYLNRVFVKGFNFEILEDGIRNYFEVKFGEDVKDVIYGQEEGIVLVIFEEFKGWLYCFYI